VSRLVAALERRVGGALFERTSRHVRLTPLGTQLRDQISPAYGELHVAIRDARQSAQEPSGRLRVGFTATTEGAALDRLLGAFATRHPDCRVVPHEVAMHDPYRELRAGHIDVLVNWLVVDEPDLTIGPAIDHQDRVLAVAAGHPLASRTSISVEDLAGLGVPELPPPFPASFAQALVPLTTPSGEPIHRARAVRTASETFTLAARGEVVHATMTSMITRVGREGIVFLPIIDLPPMPLGLIWCKAHENARIRSLAQVAAAVSSRSM
jgi:DNA-binding transcriptional LysR family regulator